MSGAPTPSRCMVFAVGPIPARASDRSGADGMA